MRLSRFRRGAAATLCLLAVPFAELSLISAQDAPAAGGTDASCNVAEVDTTHDQGSKTNVDSWRKQQYQNARNEAGLLGQAGPGNNAGDLCRARQAIKGRHTASERYTSRQ